METREIPRTEWTSFFDRFSRRHEDWSVTIEVFGTEIGAQTEAHEVSLAGITAELGQTSDKIEIMIGSKPDDHVSHIISAPAEVSFEIDERSDETVAIKAADGTTTLLRFRSAIPPWRADTATC